VPLTLPLQGLGYVEGKAGNLIDSAGNFTAVTLLFEGSDSWNSDGPTVTPNDILMKGTLKLATTNYNVDALVTGV